MLIRILFLSLFLILNGCITKDVFVEQDLTLKFEKAMKYYNKGKYNKARDEFNGILVLDNGSRLASQSQYYMAESMFELKEYDEAAISFDKYIRFSNDNQKIEVSRYRICQCSINSLNSYQRDQSQAQIALKQFQIFIEDYPESEYIVDAENSISTLRTQLAQKEYESGRLYLKQEEYESAIIYFQSVLNQYYDTPIADEARIAIVFAHILNNNRLGARNYLESQNEKFFSKNKFIEAKTLLKETKGGLTLSQYYKLYK